MILTGRTFKKAVILYKKVTFEPLTVVLLLYVVSILLIGAWGNFPVNDDFYYLMQVKAFSLGVFTKSALISSTFILQGFIGLLWGKLFGISYVSLRLLTIIFSIFCIVLVDRILNLLHTRKSIRAISLLLVIFNPWFYASSLTFMTENYFLFFILWSLYNFLLFIKTNKDKHLVLASALGGLSIMIRQYGVVLLATYLFVYILTNSRKLDFKKILCIVAPFLLFGYLGIFWPRFQSAGFPKSYNLSLFFTSFKSTVSRLTSIDVIPYVGYFLLPFTIPLLTKVKGRFNAIILFVSAPLSYSFYKIDIFKIENVFYLEGLYSKLSANIRVSIFNNVPFKLFLSYLIAVSFTTLIFLLINWLTKLVGNLQTKNLHFINIHRTENSPHLVLLVSLIGFYLVVMVTDRVFDRYLLNFFIILVIVAAIEVEKINFNAGKMAMLMCILISTTTFLLVFDYYKRSQVKWELADRLSSEMQVGRYNIFIDNVYARATYMDLKENYEGLYPPISGDYLPYCFVQEYVKQEENVLNNLINYIEERYFIKKYFANPQVQDAGLLKNKSNHFDATDILLFGKKYPSPIYNLLGKKTFVRGFCLSNYKEL